MESNKRTLIGTVGYHLLGNHSIGPVLLPDIQKLDLPVNVFIEEMNWGPIAIVQYFQALEIPFKKVIFLVAIERPNRYIGEATLFQWQGSLPSETQIQACIGDAATGVISVENLLVIGEYFKIWPKEVYLLDVEPGPEAAGEELTEEVRLRVPHILKSLGRMATHDITDDNSIHNLEGRTLFNALNHEK